MAPCRSTDILLVGKTGYGKSATANTIVGYKAFDSKPSFESVTQTAQFEFGEFEGRILKVVDGPGVADTSLKVETAARRVVDAMSVAVACNPQGYHAILLVLTFGSRYTQEDVDSVRIMKDIFGPNFITNHGILLMTHGDDFANQDMGDFDSWLLKQGSAIKEIVQECGGRVILFDNKSKDPAVRTSQVRRLLNLIDQLASEGARYTSEIFEKANESRKRLLMESKKPQLSEENLMECSLIFQDLARLDFDKPEVIVRRTETLKPRVQQLLERVIAEDMGSNSLSSSIALAKQLEISREDKMKIALAILQLNQKQKERELELGLKQACLKDEKHIINDHAVKAKTRMIQKEKEVRREKEFEEELERQEIKSEDIKELKRQEKERIKKQERSKIKEMERDEELKRLTMKDREMEEELERGKRRERELQENLEIQKSREKKLEEEIESQVKKQKELEKERKERDKLETQKIDTMLAESERQRKKDREIEEEFEKLRTEIKTLMEKDKQDDVSNKDTLDKTKQENASWTLWPVAGIAANYALGAVSKWWSGK